MRLEDGIQSAARYDLRCGDAIVELGNIIKEGYSENVGMVLADPPYGVTRNKFDNKIPMANLWSLLTEIAAHNTPVVLFSQQPFTSELIAHSMGKPLEFKTELIWEKKSPSGHLNAKIYPMKAHENILVFCKGKPRYYPQYKPSETPVTSHGGYNGTPNYGKFDPQRKDFSERDFHYPRDVLLAEDFPNVKGRGQLHPQQKPVELLRYLIRTYTNEGETVLDFSMGSGSTGVAAAMEHRNFIGIEIEESYYNIARERIGKAYEEANP